MKLKPIFKLGAEANRNQGISAHQKNPAMKRRKKNVFNYMLIASCSVGATCGSGMIPGAYAKTNVNNTSQSQNFGALLRKYQDVPLEQGDKRFVRYNAYSPEGKEAIRLYRVAVALMKNKPASDPYSWDVQAGIHGTFWTTIQALKSGMVNKGFFNNNNSDRNLSASQVKAASEARAEEAFESWEVILNNCNHWAMLWAQAQGRNAAETTPNFSTVFQAWHRLYLSAFEKIVRKVLVDEKSNSNSIYRDVLSKSDVNKWALPYWDYRDPETGSIPEAFRKPVTQEGQPNSLYESIRSPMVNRGVSVQEIALPDADMALLSADELPGKSLGSQGYSVGDYYNASVVLQQAQSLFAAFNSLSELAPHAVGHDIIGALADTQESKLDLWLAMIDLARNDGLTNFWESDSSPKNLQEILKGESLYNFAKQKKNRRIFLEKVGPSAFPQVFGENSSVGPSIIGWVPTAARDPIFWLHHAYVDKLWSEYNTMRTGAFMDEETLAIAGWNFTFWEPGKNGKPELKTYSTWKNASYLGKTEQNITPSKVLSRAYYPSYTYDYIQPLDINYQPIKAKSNKLLALLESPNLAPSLSTLTNKSDNSPLKAPLSSLAFKSIDINTPITAGAIRRIGTDQAETNDIQTSIEINIETPMNSGENIGIIVGDVNFLKENSIEIRKYWESWKAGAGLGARDGSFITSGNLSLKGLDGRPISSKESTELLGKMSLARFNPLAMSSEHNVMHGRGMTTHYTSGITMPILNQFEIAEGRVINDASQIGVMFLTSSPDSMASQHTYIKKISTALHQNLKSNTPSDGLDAMQYISENPSVINNQEFISDIDGWFKENNSTLEEKPTYLGRALRLAYVYLASNPDLIGRYKHNPLAAIDQYLSQGLSEGRSLDSWTRSVAADRNSNKSIEDQARDYVLSYK